MKPLFAVPHKESKMLVLNDLHIGVQRVAGTTPASAAALRQYALDKYQSLLETAGKHDMVVVNGDLTDRYDIEMSDMLQLYAITAEFLRKNKDAEMVWAAGNHDLSRNSNNMGSVEFIGNLLQGMFPEQFAVACVHSLLWDGIYVIPHMTNQEEFDEALAQVPKGTHTLLLHCNYDNPFAGAQDHSLNLAEDVAMGLKRRGIKMILGHEHQGREMLGGSVVITGNQFPTSVSDCLAHGEAQKDGKKYCITLTQDGKHERHETWSRSHHYKEVDWKEVQDADLTSYAFIRVVGTAERDESSEALKTVTNLRKESMAFVVTNAVKVASIDEMDVDVSVEDIRKVNVVDMLLGMLTTEQASAIQKLLDKHPL